MSDLPSHQPFLSDARVAAHATSRSPAWLWTTDGSRILWANPVGAAVFGAPSADALVARRFDPRGQIGAQIARIAGTLPYAGAPRLERLRGFGAGLGRPLLCKCARIILADRTRAVLIVALDAAGPVVSLAERVRRLFEHEGDLIGRPALAVFARDGALLFANAEARRLGSVSSLGALGAEAIADQAMTAGQADGTVVLGSLNVERLGSGTDTVLVAAISPVPEEIAAAPNTGPVSISAHAMSTAATERVPAGPLEKADEPPAETAPPTSSEPPTSATDSNNAASGEDAGAALQPSVATGTQAQRFGGPVPPLKLEVSLSERRHPLRFVWQMDTDGRFTLGSDEFTEVIGPKVAITLGRPWKEVAAELDLDPEAQVERAVATRDTWSGITVSWPVDGSEDRLQVELSGLPIYDRNRAFLGYRGFGVCRDIDRINVLAQMRRNAPNLATVDGSAPASSDEPAPSDAGSTPEKSGGHRPTASGLADERPQLTLVPTARNVVPFRAAAAAAEAKSPALSPVEHNAFRELARQLTARLKGDDDNGSAPDEVDDDESPPAASERRAPSGTGSSAVPFSTHDEEDDEALDTTSLRPLLDRLPIGILVYRFDHLIYANRAFLDWTGYRDLEALAEAGGLDSLFVEPGSLEMNKIDGADRSIAIAANSGDKIPVEGRLFSVPWNGEPALVFMLANAGHDRHRAAELALRLAEAETKELRSILETTTDGVLVVDRDGRVLSSNDRADDLFARGSGELVGTAFSDLLAPESQRLALESLETVARGPSAAPPERREVAARAQENAHIPLLMTIGRIAEGKSCIVLRDITAWKSAERERLSAQQLADKASAAKSDFLAKISHEIRTPLNSIIGFSEVMLDERFGPIGNERYREYLKDIRASGTHVMSVLSDLFDLSKIEAGELKLTFADVQLNDLVQSCVALMQPQANREHIIIRTSLLPSLGPVRADALSLRQIVLTLLSNSIRFTGGGGQVIVSTAQSDDGEVFLRVRDTGIGMSEVDLAAALEPFRQLATTPRWGSIGSGLGLPLAKALAEANHARFAIDSKVRDGTLVEIAFAAKRVLPD